MFQYFLISREKRGVEDGVNFPPRGNLEVEGHSRDDFFNFKGAGSFHLQFLGTVHVEVGGFEPDPVSYCYTACVIKSLAVHTRV